MDAVREDMVVVCVTKGDAEDTVRCRRVISGDPYQEQ